jgi:uncharacterized protein (DUF488 family)
MSENQIYTIGHSTRSLDEFVELLQHNGLRTLADIRRYPGSRRHPHFSRETLERALADAGVDYVHFEALGGRRKPRTDSPHSGIRNEQFRGYADHMDTPEFNAAVERLLAAPGRTAVMCAEAVPWRCHRNLLADDLVRRGVRVIHILGIGSVEEHQRRLV